MLMNGCLTQLLDSGHASQSDAKGTARRGEADGKSECERPQVFQFPFRVNLTYDGQISCRSTLGLNGTSQYTKKSSTTMYDAICRFIYIFLTARLSNCGLILLTS